MQCSALRLIQCSFETSPHRLLIFETSPARQGGAYSENEQTDGEGTYSERTVLLTFTLAYIHTNVSSVCLAEPHQQEYLCSAVP